ncbi:MAG: hypothetical protein ACTHW2_06785 [Tissierella sp.]|uniref:hypothetical protein n=1 Tax=Tissierella sp. TaxID=41274 RepID=UPI003F95259B
MASLEQFRKIATHCSRYNPKSNRDNSLTNSVEAKHDSCVNCSHFTDEKYCELDLIDKVLSSLAMENELKS